jgi:putative chitinase
MELSKEQLTQFLPKNPFIDHWYEVLSQLLPDYEIDTPERIASFMEQCCHESNNFTALKENLNYKPESLIKLFGKYFPDGLTDAQKICSLSNKQEAIANRIYANRMGNGSEESGDGYKYCGRGLIQLTGKDNYFWFAASISLSPEDAAEYMHTFEGAAQSACWFWENNKLNSYADRGDIKGMTRVINGGYIGLEDRVSHYEHGLHIMGV